MVDRLYKIPEKEEEVKENEIKAQKLKSADDFFKKHQTGSPDIDDMAGKRHFIKPKSPKFRTDMRSKAWEERYMQDKACELEMEYKK